MTFKHNRQRGFSLIEIMVAMVILAILGAVIVPNLLGKADDARIVKAKQDIRTLENALMMYKNENFRFPTTDQGLDALVNRPNIAPEPKNYPSNGYIQRLMKDPWDNDYVYIQPGEHGPYDLFSYGADGEPGGEGENTDIGNWNLDEIR